LLFGNSFYSSETQFIDGLEFQIFRGLPLLGEPVPIFREANLEKINTLKNRGGLLSSEQNPERSVATKAQSGIEP
jgi:hypothetical protein